MARFIKEVLHSKFPASPAGRYILNSKVLYGGSVDSKNVGNFVKYKEIDGALVGGASLKINEFKKIINATRKI